MSHSGNDLFHQVLCPDLQAGCVDAGVTSEPFILQHILVDQKLHFILVVVHQPHDTHRSRRDVQISLHILRLGKGQAGGADLGGQIFCLKGLVPGIRSR